MPRKPNIVLFANDAVGLQITRYLAERGEHIVVLVLEPKETAKFAKEIKKTAKADLVVYAQMLSDHTLQERIKSFHPHVGICAWFGYILKKEIIDLFPAGCVNLHHSYLPLGRGKYPQVWALHEGSPYGVSIHYIDERIDSGPVIAQRRLEIRETDIAGTLYERALREVVRLFKDTWPKLKKGNIRVVAQNEDEGTYHRAKDVERLDVIDLEKMYKGRELIWQLRARSFGDRTYAYYLHNGKKVYIKVSLSEKQNF